MRQSIHVAATVVRLPQQFFHPRIRTQWTRQMHSQSNGVRLRLPQRISFLLGISSCSVRVGIQMVHCCGGCGFHNKTSSCMLGLCGPSECVTIQMECCCGFHIKSHFLVSCFCVVAAVSALYLIFLSSSAQRSSNLFASPALVFFIVLTLCALCCFDFLLVAVFFSRDIFLWCCDDNLCHNTSVVASHVDHVVCFGISAAVHMFSVHQYVIQLFLSTFRCPVGSLLSTRFSVHRVEWCEILYHQPLLHQVTSLVSLVDCVRTNTDTLNSIPWSQFGIEVSSHNFMFLALVFMCFSIDL